MNVSDNYVDGLLVRIAELEAEIAKRDQEDKNRAIEEEIATADSGIAGLRLKYQAVLTRMAELESERDRLAAQIERLDQTCRSMAVEIGELADESNTIGAERDRLNTRIAELEDEVERWRNTTRERISLRAERDKLRAALKHIMCQHNPNDLDNAIVAARAALEEPKP